MVTSRITTRNRHVYSNNSTKHDGEIGYNSTIEINTHVNTHCFGKNFRIMKSTEQLCSVTAFLEELANTNNVGIVKSAISMIDDYGAIFISVFVQGINLTKKMDKVLISPHQCRSFGFQCMDDPTDSTKKLGFYSNNVFLTLSMQGTNCLE